MACLRFAEALDLVLTELTGRINDGLPVRIEQSFQFVLRACPVVKAATPESFQPGSRCVLDERYHRPWVGSVGIQVVERM